MKFIEETTALCQECKADKICKAHIVEKEGQEFLRVFCKQCGDNFIKIVNTDEGSSKKGNAISNIFTKKIYKNLTVFALIGILAFTAIMMAVGLKFYMLTSFSHPMFGIVAITLITVLWAVVIKRILCGGKKCKKKVSKSDEK